MTLSNNGPMDAADYEEPLTELESNLSDYEGVTLDDESAAKLNDLLKEIQKVGKDADKSRVALKEPHLVAGRKVDDDFRPIKEKAGELHKTGKGYMTAYLVEQKRIADEARRKAEQEAAEKARIAEQLAKDALIGEDVKRDAEEAAKAVDLAKAQAENSGRAGSYQGGARTMSLRTSYEAVLSDPKAAAIHFADHPRVQDAIISAANAILRGSDRPDAIPGIEIKKIQKAA
ncbi:hypothetical protein [Litorimonas sp.]|uniref:hypothetical protein n=1 Tax=Litorimonas sp. TaxID=1892381 RepID=UPI003A8C4796